VIAKLAQEPMIWFAVVLATYCALLAVVLRSEKAVHRNRNTYFSPELLEISKHSE
jgi:hypothetical protein